MFPPSRDQKSCSQSQSNGSKYRVIWVVILDTRLTWSSHTDKVRKKAAQRGRGVVLVPLPKIGRLFIKNGILLYKQLISPVITRRAPYGASLKAPTSEGYRCYYPRVCALLPVHHGLRVAGRFARIWEFHCSPTTTASFGSRSADVGNPLARQLGRYLGLAPVFRRASQARPE